jgi:DNA replication licensing factor MCM4
MRFSVMVIGTIDMDLINTRVSASERMRRANLISSLRIFIMERMQVGGPSTRIREVTFFILS